MDKRELDVGLLVLMARIFMQEYRETGLLEIASRDDEPSVQVEHNALAEVSIPDVWDWATHSNPHYKQPWVASVTIAGIVFFALFTDGEKQAVIDER